MPCCLGTSTICCFKMGWVGSQGLQVNPQVQYACRELSQAAKVWLLTQNRCTPCLMQFIVGVGYNTRNGNLHKMLNPCPYCRVQSCLLVCGRYNHFNGRRNKRLENMLDILLGIERQYFKEHHARLHGMRGKNKSRNKPQ